MVLVEPPERSDDRPFVGQSSMRLRMALLGLKYPVGSFSDAEISKVTLEPSRHWMSREPHKPYRVVEAAVSQFTSTVRKIFAPPQHTPRNEQTVSIPVGDD